MTIDPLQIGETLVEVIANEPLSLPSAADCNSPCWWSENGFNILTSTGHPILSSGTDVEHLRPIGDVSFTAWRDGGRWIESVHQEPNGWLLGWYHNEPAGLCPGTHLTAPKIGATRSTDNGATWRDLGIVLEAPPGALNCATRNFYFAGGHGDFCIMADGGRRYLYFFFSTYVGGAADQGVAVARMRFADREQPVGKVWKWHAGKWKEPGLGGQATPIFTAAIDWHRADADAFWGPSVHWNSHLQQYVMLLNRAIDKDWTQEAFTSRTPPISRRRSVGPRP